MSPAGRGAVAQADDWERHWEDYASSADQNPAQKFRRRLITSLLGRAPERLLDIGSGQGGCARDLRAAFPGAQILGLELSATGVEAARHRVPSAQFMQCDLLEDREPPPQFSGWATHAVCSEVLEHLDRPEQMLRNVTAWMAPGCRLVVTVPGGPMSSFDRHIGHRKHYAPDDVRGLLEAAGFRVERAHGAGFPFFNLYRCVVIARGERLIEDVARKTSFGARVAMGAFDALFRLNLRSAGWQTVAVGIAEPAGSDRGGAEFSPFA